MRTRTLAPLSLVVAALAACRATPLAHQPDGRPLTPLFDPAISQEIIRGRTDSGDAVLLLVGAATMVRLDLKSQHSTRVPIEVPAGETCWGFAGLDDGSVWSLRGRTTIIRIETDGRVSREIPLPEPHIGLFGSADRLIYQKAIFTPPGPALRAAIPGGEIAATWSDMTTRAFPGIARAQLTALNMVACGSSARVERPCWFPDEAAISLIGPRGETRRIELPGLTVVAPEVLLAAENPPRPVRDARVDDRGRIWVLSSGVAPVGTPDLPGGWILARYAADGTAQGQVRLAEPARLILRANDNRVTVLSGSGQVSEVKPW